MYLMAAANVTAPILLISILGFWFKRIELLSGDFVASGNRLVFNVGLPCLIFLSVSQSPIRESLNVSLVLYAAGTIVCVVVLLRWLSVRLIASQHLGVFVQNAYRGNMGIVGLALCINAFGEQILPKAGIYLALMSVLYNILAVMLLSDAARDIHKNLVNNPLIIAVVLGLGFSATGLTLPTIIYQSGLYFGQLTLPLALLCIGASLQWQSLKDNKNEVVWAVSFKLVWIPLAICAGAIAMGYRGEDLGILFLMMASPTAAAAFVMAKQLTAYGAQAAEGVALSTALAPVTITIGLIILSSQGWLSLAV